MERITELSAALARLDRFCFEARSGATPQVLEISPSEANAILKEIECLRAVAGAVSQGESFQQMRDAARATSDEILTVIPSVGIGTKSPITVKELVDCYLSDQGLRAVPAEAK